MATTNTNFKVKNGLDAGGNLTTTAGLQVGTTATVNGNFTTYGTGTIHANQQLSLAVRNGANYAGNLLQYSLNDTTVTGGRTARGLLWAGSTGFENNNTYNLSATNPYLTSSTATFTVSTVQTYNPFAAGQKITVSGASQAQYNGSWITTAVGGSSGAWTVTVVAGGTTTPFTNSGALTATGTIAVEPAGFFKQPHPGAVGLVIKGAGTSGTATDIFRYVNSSGSTQTYITAAGDIVAPAISAIWSITTSAQDRNVIPLRTRFSTTNGQANIQTWETSTTVQAGVNPVGQFFTGTTVPVRGSTSIAVPIHTPTGTTDITLTLSATHNIQVGQTVEIAGVTPSGYNGVWRAQNGTTGSTLVLNIGSNPGAITVAGLAYISPQVSITPTSVASSGLVVKGLASQTANLFEAQASTGAVLASMSSVGNTQLPILGVGGTALSSLGGTLRVMNSGSGAVGVTIRGASGQSADLLQIQNNTPSTLLKVDQNGFLVVGGSSVISNALISSTAYGTTQIGLAIRGTAGHTANLTEWQTSTPTTVASVSAAGVISTSAGLTLSGASSPITLNGSVGTSGQVLTSAGAGATPTWTTVSGGSFTGGTLTSDLVLAAGSTTVEPLTFQSNSSTPTTTSGAMDYDGTVFYQTANTNPGRALNSQYYYYASSADYGPDFSTSGSVQSMLGAATRGITVAAGTTYEYELYATVQHQYVTNTGITGTYQITNTTVSGSPTVAVVHQIDYGSNTTNFTTATTLSTIRTTGSVVFSAAISSGSRYNFIRAKGIIRVTGTGTTKLYPGLSLSAASGDNVWNIQNGLVFKLTPIGNGTVTNVGTWS